MFGELKQRFFNSKLFKDSFWAVFGNGMGNGIMLLSSILIARFLGKDLYGQYGIVKSTMFLIASFSTLGLAFTSTKFVASAINQDPLHIKSIVRDSFQITLSFSGFIAFVLFVFANKLASYLEEPGLAFAFKTLAVVIVFKALTTTQIGILSGFKDFKTIAHNSLLSGLFMLFISIPLAYFVGLKGALTALLSSQIFNCLINFFAVRKFTDKLDKQEDISYKKSLFSFTFPVALQESSFTICHWGAVLLLTKLSSLGELGLYSASSQWNSVILMIPVLLNNVILSHLSSSEGTKHKKIVKLMLMTNFLSTFIPFLIVYVLAEFIASFYGSSFSVLPNIMRVSTFVTIFEACSGVFKSELMSNGKTWLLFSIRLFRDVALLVFVYFSLTYTNGENGAYQFALSSLSSSILFFFVLAWFCRKSIINN